MTLAIPATTNPSLVGIGLLFLTTFWAIAFGSLALRDHFLIDDSAILPPLSTSALWWSELVELSLTDDNSEGPTPQFVLRLHSKRDRIISLPLSKFERESLLTFIAAIEQHAPDCRNLSLLSELPRFFDYEQGTLTNLSYTQLWDSVTNNKFELSCFTPLAQGTCLQEERIRVQKQLSAGGFSAVYLVEDDEHQQKILKEFVLPFGIDETTKEKALEHFEREARLLIKLNHPQLARVFDHFVEQGRHYLILEFIDGLNMRSYIGTHGIQNERTVEAWTIALARVIDHLHEQTPPIIHRDISPDNIVIRKDGVPFLIDFGAANEFVGSATGTLIGKHAYMAPEQIRGKAEPISDIYSLGATVYFCLTGCDPEPLRTTSPKQFNTSVTQRLDDLVRSCTALETPTRCGSAKEVIERLSSNFC